MKRILLLCLCLALLFALGCKEEPISPEGGDVTPEGEWGEFTTEDGYITNTLITAEMNTTNLQAPVIELSYSLCDNGSFGVTHTYYTERNDYRTHRLEIYKDGAWQEAPTGGNFMTERALMYGEDTAPKAHRKHDFTIELNSANSDGLVQYKALEKGDYRLIVTYILNTNQAGVTIPEGKHAALLYFTVT